MSRLVARGAVTVMLGLDHLGVDVARPGDTEVPRSPQDYRGRRRNSLFSATNWQILPGLMRVSGNI
jgi:hypothetical protein